MALKRAYVRKNTGDGGRGRIRISFEENPNVDPDKLPLAEYCSPFGGGDHVDGAGFFFVPEVGSQVWVMEEGYEGSGRWVWIGSSFYDEGGYQNAPIEARADNFPPLNRIIRTRGGNRLELDDREIDMTGNPTFGVRLLNGVGDGLEATKDGGIRLGFGQTNGSLFLGKRGIKLISNAGNGLYINDKYDAIRIVAKKENVWQNWIDGKITQFADKGIKITTNSIWDLTAKKGVNISARGGEISLKGNSYKLVTIGDIKLQSGANVNINANQYNISGQAGSNLIVDLPVPGDGTLAGNIFVNTATGNNVLRVGPFPPFPGSPPVNSGSLTLNDPLFGTLFKGRIGIGPAGHAVLEGSSGGIWVSPVPVMAAGTAGGSGGRKKVPLAPIVTNPITPVIQPPLSPSSPPSPITGVGPQHMVLGNNLLFTLQKLVLNLLNITDAMINNASAFAMSPMGPAPLNPLIIQQLGIMKTELTAIMNSNLSSSPTPSNILSSLVFIDG